MYNNGILKDAYVNLLNRFPDKMDLILNELSTNQVLNLHMAFVNNEINLERLRREVKKWEK